nr:unnamed protein product [Callosobruchus analis]
MACTPPSFPAIVEQPSNPNPTQSSLERSGGKYCERNNKGQLPWQIIIEACYSSVQLSERSLGKQHVTSDQTPSYYLNEITFFPNRPRVNEAVFIISIDYDYLVYPKRPSQTFDDYGHLRFGKKNDLIDDYDHLRFGKRNDMFDDYDHLRFGKKDKFFDDYGHMRYGREYEDS